jgi:excisionase family DNA binding protein
MKVLTTKDAAAALGISLRQVQTLVKQGKLPARKIGRDYVINESDLRLVKHRPKGRPPKPTAKRRPNKAR